MASGAQDMLIKGSFDTAALFARRCITRSSASASKAASGRASRNTARCSRTIRFRSGSTTALTLRFLAVNEATVSEYGYSREEFLRMTLLDIQPPEEAQKTDPCDRGRARRPASSSTSGAIGARTARVFDVEINAQSIDFRGRHARIVLARDITMRKRAIRALEVSEGRFRKLFQHSLGLICTHDLDGVLIR